MHESKTDTQGTCAFFMEDSGQILAFVGDVADTVLEAFTRLAVELISIDMKSEDWSWPDKALLP